MSAPLIYIIAGEASGDMLGAGLMKALKAKEPGIRFAGIGGEIMQAEGLQSLFPYRDLSIMGFWEILPHIPKLLRRLRETMQDIIRKKPDMVITIDSPGFNFRLAGMLKKNPATQLIKRIHYVAPSVWAYKPGRAEKTAKLFDLLLTLLPFEPPYFQKVGLKTVFVGHPVLWNQHSGNAKAFRARHGLEATTPLLLLLPGSRIGEVQRHLPIFLEAVRTLPDYKIVILAGPQVKTLIAELAPETLVVDTAEKWDVFAAADMALSKSGTVTLELAVAGVPMVVAHSVNALSAWLIRQMILIRYVSLVNIAADKPIIPELLQQDCTPAAIAAALKQLQPPAAKARQQAEMAQALQILSGSNAMNPDAVAADAVLKFLSHRLH